MDAERAINKWWDDGIDVNDLHGSLVAALAAAGFAIVPMNFDPKPLPPGAGPLPSQTARRDLKGCAASVP